MTVTWRQYLKGLYVNRVDVAADGAVFATALFAREPQAVPDRSLGGLYVITHEAVVAATE